MVISKQDMVCLSITCCLFGLNDIVIVQVFENTESCVTLFGVQYRLHAVFQITASPSARSRQLWRRTGNIFKTFLQYHVLDLRFKAAGLTTFLIEF